MDEDMRTLWCGNLSERVTEEILYELFLQGGPVQRVSIPKDREGKQRTYGFVTYKHLNSVSYALSLFDGTMLFNRPLSISTRNNTELPHKEHSQDQSFNLNHMLQLGQQMMLGINMLPNFGPYSQQVDVYSGKDDRRSRRMHPYHREQNGSNNNHHNNHRDHRSRSNHNNHRDDYSRRDYKSRRNYR